MFSWNVAMVGSGAVSILALALLAPTASSAEMFAWRTDDGVFAYADDREKIPARYSDRAVRVGSQRFGDYERLTVEDSQTSRAVHERLRERLAYLRAFNGDESAAAGTPRGGAGTTITVATGSPQAPTLDITSGEGDGPVVVETVLGKSRGDMVTRSSTIVTRDGHTLAVLKGRRTTHNLSTDIVDLDEIDE